MMTARDIVEELAKARRVEELCRNVCKRPAAELDDLAQLVYVKLLCSRPELIQDLYTNGQLDFYLVRVIANEYHSKDRSFYRIYQKYAERASPLTDKEYEKADCK